MKPCPFCGGAGKIKGLNSTAIYVRCCLCGCRTGSRRDIRKAIEAWNTRYERTCRIVPHGHLITLSDGTKLYESACSECGAYLGDEDNYCSICGAKVVE